MKALSIRAPYWWFILHRGKLIENRDWYMRFRGTIAIHASKRWCANPVDAAIREAQTIGALRKKVSAADLRAMQTASGCIVGTIEIVDCVRQSKSPWFTGKYGFILENPVPLQLPLPCKGALNLFRVPNDLEVQLRAQGVNCSPPSRHLLF